MKHLQTYRLFETQQTLTQEQKDFLDEYTIGTWSLNPSTGKVDVEGDFICEGNHRLPGQLLKDFKGIHFGEVTGSFSCKDQWELKSLKGSPETVGGNFNCKDCIGLRNLIGGPTEVRGSFLCSGCKYLDSLKGAPEVIGGGFYCTRCWNLKSLKGGPREVGGNFDCDDCRSLQSLEGAPEILKGSFYFDDLRVRTGEWSLETLIQMFIDGTPWKKRVIGPLVDPAVLQQKIDRAPEEMLMRLKDHLKHPHFQGLKWPKHLEGEKDLLSDLSDVGL